VDAGWIPYAHQMGQIGKTVSPDLHVAAGITDQNPVNPVSKGPVQPPRLDPTKLEYMTARSFCGKL
jgi:hypothetical protein